MMIPVTTLTGGLLLILAPALQSCTRAEAGSIRAVDAHQEPVDSIALTRQSGVFELRSRRADGRIYGYRVVIGGPTVRFQVTGGDRKGATETFEVAPDMTRDIIASAASLQLEDLPDSIPGKEPWCDVVLTDHQWVVLEVFRGSTVQRIVDYQGCPVECDRSSDRLLSRLRDLEEEVNRALRLEDRFDAAPFTTGGDRPGTCRWEPRENPGG